MATTATKTAKVVKAVAKKATGKAAKVETRHVVRYTEQSIKRLKENDARPTSKRGMLLTALLPAKTVEQARKAFAKVHYKGPQIPFSSIMRWMVVNKYIALK